jgi:hypothetical protein
MCPHQGDWMNRLALALLKRLCVEEQSQYQAPSGGPGEHKSLDRPRRGLEHIYRVGKNIPSSSTQALASNTSCETGMLVIILFRCFSPTQSVCFFSVGQCSRSSSELGTVRAGFGWLLGARSHNPHLPPWSFQ